MMQSTPSNTLTAGNVSVFTGERKAYNAIEAELVLIKKKKQEL